MVKKCHWLLIFKACYSIFLSLVWFVGNAHHGLLYLTHLSRLRALYCILKQQWSVFRRFLLSPESELWPGGSQPGLVFGQHYPRFPWPRLYPLSPSFFFLCLKFFSHSLMVYVASEVYFRSLIDLWYKRAGDGVALIPFPCS